MNGRQRGDSVYVLNEGYGTVVDDHGFAMNGRRVLDRGVTVQLDDDGTVIECAHIQVIDDRPVLAVPGD